MRIEKHLADSSERTRSFQAARLETEVTELLCELMEKEGVTRAELARRVGTSPPYVTKVLRGRTNLTLKSVSDLFFALGRSVRIIDRPLDTHSPRLLALEIATESGKDSAPKPSSTRVRRSR